jgi:hypothetical protein
VVPESTVAAAGRRRALGGDTTMDTDTHDNRGPDGEQFPVREANGDAR